MNKRLGYMLIGISVLMVIVLIAFTSIIRQQGETIGCFGAPGCGSIDTSLSLMHFAFGVIGFILALGVYLIFFYRAEEAILKRLDEDKENKISDIRFSILMSALDETEQKVLKVAKEQSGISQSTLVLRSGLSKAKVSEVLSSFEKKKLIEKKKKGKMNFIYYYD